MPFSQLSGQQFGGKSHDTASLKKLEQCGTGIYPRGREGGREGAKMLSIQISSSRILYILYSEGRERALGKECHIKHKIKFI